MKMIEVTESRERCAEAGWFAYDMIFDEPMEKTFIRSLETIPSIPPSSSPPLLPLGTPLFISQQKTNMLKG